MDYNKIGPDIIESLNLYVNHRIPTGDFLLAVLSNDLREAVGRADSENIQVIPEIVAYIYNRLPADCWGSRDKVRSWLKARKVS